MTHRMCAVCGPESDHLGGKPRMKTLPLVTIPNIHQLEPHLPHTSHDLYDGKLLEPAGVISESGEPVIIDICHECLASLKLKTNTPPRLSLANNLWIGKIPEELYALTFPEQLLVALLYPHVFVFKLYPKKVGGKQDNLQWGIGKPDATSSCNPSVNPNSDFCGTGKATEGLVALYIQNVGLVDEEQNGYVPDSEDINELNEGFTQCNDPNEQGKGEVIPLQASGAIDTDLSAMTANELMGWGLMNLWTKGEEGAYAVRHGSKPMCRKTFEAEARLMSSITKEALEKAERQEAKNEPITDPAVRMLHSQVQTTSGHIIGSNAI
ncbi:hypothetical protein F5879DRAFT_927674 [Lentinula edodes]|nr:hypothetical protein F5879DRAFT_927674 [Lentinula edodes]